ncbi:hypothetical protein SO694_000011134 [Aureococcus anophagefferens]|uniref:Glycoside hydrolase 123-like N-terminal domain-containing protein n=1 Tax=Aureococcus anophagefferens TaxID=44056 RepID=A0ABR1GC17_AURAN
MGAAPLRFLLLLAVTFAEENAVFSDDDNFVSPTAAADATEAALKSSSGGASSAWSEALQAAVAREAKAWATAPADVAAATRDAAAAVAGGAHAVAAWPLRDPAPRARFGARALDALKKLQPTTDTVAVPLGETGVALVAVVAGRAMANATTAGALTVRAGGRAVATARLTLEAPPPAAARASVRAPARVACLASAAPRRAPAAEPVDDRIIDLGLGRSLALARGKRAGLGVFAAVSRGGADLFDDRGLRLELAPDCGAWKRTSDVLTRSLDDGAPVFVWRWTSACGESRVSFEARVAPRDARVVAAATVEAPAPWDDVSVVASFRPGAAPLAAGLGLRSGAREKRHAWTWAPSRPLDARKGSPPGMGAEGSVWDQFAWLGTVDLGAKLRLLSARDRSAGDDGDGPQLDWKLSPPYPAGWRHGGMGWTTDDGVVTLRASGGPAAKHKRRGVFGRKGAASATRLDFSFAVTPARALTPAAIFAPEMRRFHAKQWDPPDCAALAKRGVRGVSLHQGGLLNPRARRAPREKNARASPRNAPGRPTAGRGRTARSTRASARATTSSPGARRALGGARRPARGAAPRGTDDDVAASVAAGGAWLRFFQRGARHLALCGGMKGFYMDGISARRPRHRRRARGAERALSKVASKKNAPHRAPFLDLHAANKTAVYLELYPHMDAVWTGEASNYELGPDHFLAGVRACPSACRARCSAAPCASSRGSTTGRSSSA